MATRNILHVVSVSFSLPYFVGKQFLYFKEKDERYNFYVACSPSNELTELSNELDFSELPLNIERSISPLADLKAIAKLIKFIRKNKIEIVVGHTPKGGMIAMIAAFFAGVERRIYFRHGIMYETSKGLKRLLLKTIERMTGSFATQVVCVSQEIKLISNNEKLSSPNKNIILDRGTCNGVDCELKYNPAYKNEVEFGKLKGSLGIDKSNFVVGYVGRLVRDKGINELISAWQIITEKYPKAKLLLVGPIEERDKISEVTKQTIFNNPSIIYTGFVSDASIYYPLMDVFILPSYREGFPTVILEASAMQLPVLTTRATGCSEAIIENETGNFIEIDHHKIAEAIENYINKPVKLKEMGANGRRFVERYFEQTHIWDMIENKLIAI